MSERARRDVVLLGLDRRNLWLWSDGSLRGIERTVRHGAPRPKEYRSPNDPMGGAQLTGQQIDAVEAYV